MTGHIDDPHFDPSRQVQVGEAELDGDAARLLFRQAVRVDAGQRLHERSFAVVDVAGGAEYQVFHK